MPGLILMCLGMTICYYWIAIFIKSDVNLPDLKKQQYGRLILCCYCFLVLISVSLTIWIIVDFYSTKSIATFDYLWQNLFLLNGVLCLLNSFTLLISGRKLSNHLQQYAFHENGAVMSGRVRYT